MKKNTGKSINFLINALNLKSLIILFTSMIKDTRKFSHFVDIITERKGKTVTSKNV